MLKHTVLMACTLVLACSLPASARDKDDGQANVVVVDQAVPVTMMIAEEAFTITAPAYLHQATEAAAGTSPPVATPVMVVNTPARSLSTITSDWYIPGRWRS